MSKRLLLDTCAAIYVAESQPVSDLAIRALNAAAEPGSGILLSPVTAWEVGMLAAKRRIILSMDPLAYYRLMLSQPATQELPLTPTALVASSFLPDTPHADPFDRIIIATAREHGLTILTRDRLILAYADQGHVSALAC